MLSLTDSNEYSLTEAHPEAFAKLLGLIAVGKITSRVAKDLLPKVVFEGSDALVLATEGGLLQENNADALDALIAQVIADNLAVVLEYKSGKETSIQYLVGQAMKISKGSANPGALLTKLKEALTK